MLELRPSCENCNDGFNPHLIVASYLITQGDVPLDEGEILGTEDLNSGLAFHAYPNPTSGLLNIEFSEPAQELEVRVFNGLGQLTRVFQEDFATSTLAVDLSGLTKGIYSIEVKTDHGVDVKKIIVE